MSSECAWRLFGDIPEVLFYTWSFMCPQGAVSHSVNHNVQTPLRKSEMKICFHLHVKGYERNCIVKFIRNGGGNKIVNIIGREDAEFGYLHFHYFFHGQFIGHRHSASSS